MNDYTPIIKQYLRIKNEHKDTLLFFRMGDFYEFFFNDAKIVSKLLTLALTSKYVHKGKKIPMAGIPKHTVEYYISKLIKMGKKIALCEQFNNIKKEDGLIERKVVKIITPGTFVPEESLSNNETTSYICSIISNKNTFGVSYLDIITGNFFLTQVNTIFDLQNEIDKIAPTEIITPEKLTYKLHGNLFINEIKSKIITYENAIDILEKKLIQDEKNKLLILKEGTIAAAFLLNYIIETKNKVNNIQHLKIINKKNILYIDHNSRKNLEIFTDLKGNKDNSLFKYIDNTSTIMGKRLLRTMLLEPSIETDIIANRSTAVTFLKDNQLYTKIKENLNILPDLEKILYKLTSYSIKPIELKKLEVALKKINNIKNILKNIDPNIKLLQKIYLNLHDYSDIINLINKSISDNPAVSIKEGHVIKAEYDKKLDELRHFLNNINEDILKYENEERIKLQYKNLKISFKNKDGHYIDIPKNIKIIIPNYYKKIKSLSYSNRFTTPKLETLEKNILISEKQALHRENRLYMLVIYKIKKKYKLLNNTIAYTTQLDILTAFAEKSSLFNWNAPKISNNMEIKIKNGRHPILEKTTTTQFIPNDLELNFKTKNIIITGANMGGKSTYIRQIALIIILTYIGSHVPAEHAEIGKITKILTRIGANDDLINSYSTFALEIKEMSDIINIADENSLVLIDEIGRGTDYFEGKALAASILNELTVTKKPFVLFSTHFHDLFKYIKKTYSTKNIYFKVKNVDDKIIFFYKWKNGSSKKSYGIKVAKISGLNKKIITDAEQILKSIKKKNKKYKNIIHFIKNINLDLTTPKEALLKLYYIKNNILEKKKY